MKFPFRYAEKYGVLLREENEDAIELFVKASLRPDIFFEIQRYIQKPFKITKISEDLFQQYLNQHYSERENTEQTVEAIQEDMDLSEFIEQLPQRLDLVEGADEAPIIRLINVLCTQALKQHASDIHLEVFEQKVWVRFRIDGVMREITALPRTMAPLLISRVKVMAKLDIAEKRLPQDGRIALRIAGKPLDIRVSILPTNYGERVVMRLLDKKSGHMTLVDLGMSDVSLTHIKKIMTHPHGIFLVTGPTGSGKTTTLYALLNVLNTPMRNILTVEDPIEYDIPGVGQTQVNTKVELSFAKGLRAILRQDPDVVMVGEIRDLETAEIAVQASLTGHLVLSTLHTNSAIGAITRLRDMGIEPYLLSSSLIGVAAQRLVRMLCDACKKARLLTTHDCEEMNISYEADRSIYEAVGCAHCFGTGYLGRTAIYEVISLDTTLLAMIHDSESEQALADYAHRHAPTLREDGMRLVLAGKTTLEEVLRITRE